MQGQQKWCEGQKETNSDGVEHVQRAKAPPICIQPIHERWAMGQGIQRVWFGGGEKEGVYFRVPAQTSLEPLHAFHRCR